jgi:hypothetical protein
MSRDKRLLRAVLCGVTIHRARPETLREAYLSSEEHSAMTSGALRATYLRHGQEVPHGREGDELESGTGSGRYR